MSRRLIDLVLAWEDNAYRLKARFDSSGRVEDHSHVFKARTDLLGFLQDILPERFDNRPPPLRRIAQLEHILSDPAAGPEAQLNAAQDLLLARAASKDFQDRLKQIIQDSAAPIETRLKKAKALVEAAS